MIIKVLVVSRMAGCLSLTSLPLGPRHLSRLLQEAACDCGLWHSTYTVSILIATRQAGRQEEVYFCVLQKASQGLVDCFLCSIVPVQKSFFTHLTRESLAA
jgi:hypothetical protein